MGEEADRLVRLVDDPHIAVSHRLGIWTLQMLAQHLAKVRPERVVVIDVGEPIPSLRSGGERGIQSTIDRPSALGIRHHSTLRIFRLQAGDTFRRARQDVKHAMTRGRDRCHRRRQKR